MTISIHDLRQQLLAWAQNQTIHRRVADSEFAGDIAAQVDLGLAPRVSDAEVVDELFDCMQPHLGSLANLRLADLSPREQAVAEIVAYKISKLPGYPGTPSDAVTDAIDIVRAAGFVLP